MLDGTNCSDENFKRFLFLSARFSKISRGIAAPSSQHVSLMRECDKLGVMRFSYSIQHKEDRLLDFSNLLKLNERLSGRIRRRGPKVSIKAVLTSENLIDSTR